MALLLLEAPIFGNFGPAFVALRVLMDSARDKACPAGSPAPYDYPGPIPAAYNASCVGTADVNGFYGDGIVNALNAVQ